MLVNNKIKTTLNTTLSEQFQDPTEKILLRVKIDGFNKLWKITLIYPQRNKIKYKKYQTVREVSRSTRNKVKTETILIKLLHMYMARIFLIGSVQALQ